MPLPYRFVIDLPTSRIVFFTDDLSQHLATDNQCVIADYTGALPDAMTARNSWNYKFCDQQIIIPVAPELLVLSIIDQNRNTYVRYITLKITERLAEFESAPRLILLQTINRAALDYEKTRADNKWLVLIQKRYKLETQHDAMLLVMAEYEKTIDMFFDIYNLKEHTLIKLQEIDDYNKLTSIYNEFLENLRNIKNVNHLV